MAPVASPQVWVHPHRLQRARVCQQRRPRCPAEIRGSRGDAGRMVVIRCDLGVGLERFTWFRMVNQFIASLTPEVANQIMNR